MQLSTIDVHLIHHCIQFLPSKTGTFVENVNAGTFFLERIIDF